MWRLLFHAILLLLLDYIKDAFNIDETVAKCLASFEHLLTGLHLFIRKHLVKLVQMIAADRIARLIVLM